MSLIFEQSSEFILLGGYGLAALSAYLLVKTLVQEEAQRSAEDNLGEGGSSSKSGALRSVRPFLRQYLVPMIQGKEGWEKKRTNYRRKLISAGLKNDLTADEYISLKLFLVVFLPLAIVMAKVLKLIELDINALVICGSIAAGWMGPDQWLDGIIQKRFKEVKRALPFVVDLLALSTEAGMDFIGAIGKVVEKAKPSPFIEELEQVLKEIKVGSSRSEALQEMAIRLDMREISSFVAILVSAEQMGASIGKTLRQQSDQIRVQRFLEAEKAGAAAVQKLVVVTMVVVLPAVFLMTLGPFLVSAMQDGGP